jgi:RimJ/RimL family protein N-acetyltransferase
MPWALEKQSVEETESKIRQFHANWLTPRTDLTMGIFYREDSRLLGGTGLHRIDWDIRSFEIGYWIRPEEEGKGLVTESTFALCKLAFETLDARRVFIRCRASNVRSAAIPLRLGFQLEGRMLNGALTEDGAVEDMLSFGITPELWAKALGRSDQSP